MPQERCNHTSDEKVSRLHFHSNVLYNFISPHRLFSENQDSSFGALVSLVQSKALTPQQRHELIQALTVAEANPSLSAGDNSATTDEIEASCSSEDAHEGDKPTEAEATGEEGNHDK